MALVKLDPGDAADHTYRFVNADGTQRVNSDGTFTHIVNVTVASALYGVQFTFTILKSTWDAGGAPPLEAEHAAWVDEICGYPHVIGFHSEPEQGPDQVIYNFGKILVGPDGSESGVEVSQRMDRLNSPSTFAMIDAAWKNFTDAGAS